LAAPDLCSRGRSANFLRCGTARCLLLRLRLVAAEHLFVALPLRIRFSKLQLIDRISFNRTSQSSICDVNTAWVEPRAVNKWNCVFAARIVFKEIDSASLNGPFR
jgi:hypothetical protein